MFEINNSQALAKYVGINRYSNRKVKRCYTTIKYLPNSKMLVPRTDR